MRILKVIHGYPPTYNAGSEVYSRSICEELAKTETVQVFTREQDDYRLDFQTRAVNVNDIPLTVVNLAREKDGYEHASVNEIFRRALNDFKPDIIHIGHLNHLSLGIVNEAKNLNIPIVYTLHDFWLMCPRGQFLQRNFDGQSLYQLCDEQEDKKCATSCYSMLHSCDSKDKDVDIDYWTTWINRRMEAVKNIIPLIDEFIAPSKYLINRFINDFDLPKEKITYLDYGFPTHYLKPVQRKSKRPFTFGYIGTHIPAKGVNLLIEAFTKIKTPSKLIIWGRHTGQNTTSLQALAKTSYNQIEFKNEYENPNIVNEVFNHIDAIVVPSIWGENSPLVIHEAQACKTPVITANYGGMKEYVNHKINGLLFEHRNVNDLQIKMKWALKHQGEMEFFGKRGYLFSEDGNVPDIKSHCQTLKQIYTEIISKNESKKRTLENYY